MRRGTDGRFVLERLDRPGQGEVVEWAVVLRRFDEDQTFDRIARRGELKEERIVQLVDAIVAWGSVDDIHERIEAQHDAGAAQVVVIPLNSAGGVKPDWDLLTELGKNA